jgi:hypothetical protein
VISPAIAVLDLGSEPSNVARMVAERGHAAIHGDEPHRCRLCVIDATVKLSALGWDRECRFAAAQGWEEYSYPDYAFSVAFSANPQVETSTYQVADNRSVPAHVYSVRQGNAVFKMTVAELAGTNLEDRAVIDHAIKTLSASGTVKVNIPRPHLPRQRPSDCVEGAEGSRSMVAMFDILEWRGLPPASGSRLRGRIPRVTCRAPRRAVPLARTDAGGALGGEALDCRHGGERCRDQARRAREALPREALDVADVLLDVPAATCPGRRGPMGCFGIEN